MVPNSLRHILTATGRTFVVRVVAPEVALGTMTYDLKDATGAV